MELLQLLESTGIKAALVVKRWLRKGWYTLKVTQLFLEVRLWREFGMSIVDRGMIHRRRRSTPLERSVSRGRRRRWLILVLILVLIRVLIPLVFVVTTSRRHVITRIVNFKPSPMVVPYRSHRHAVPLVQVHHTGSVAQVDHAVPVIGATGGRPRTPMFAMTTLPWLRRWLGVMLKLVTKIAPGRLVGRVM